MANHPRGAGNSAFIQASLPITSLDPEASIPQHTAITGIIALIWPYSSATQTIAFLLAEPNASLRGREKAQVRVQFASHAAKEVASAKAGIGDRVVLNLDGAVWVNGKVPLSTPGRSVDGDLRFTRKVALEILSSRDRPGVVSNGQDRDTNRRLASISLNVQDSTPPTSPQGPSNDREFTVPKQLAFKTPQRRTASDVWSTPLMFGSSPHSGILSSPDDDFFYDDDGSIPARGRKRTKFARKSAEWRFEGTDAAVEASNEPRGASLASDVLELVDDLSDDDTQPVRAASAMSEDVQAQSIDVDVEPGIDLDQDAASVSARPQSTSFSPHLQGSQQRPTLLVDLTEATSDGHLLENENEPPNSPRLEPISNPSLPVVSPLESHLKDASLVQLLLPQHGERSPSKGDATPSLQTEIAAVLDFGFDGSGVSKVLQPQNMEESVSTSQDQPPEVGASAVETRQIETQSQIRNEDDVVVVTEKAKSVEADEDQSTALESGPDNSRQSSEDRHGMKPQPRDFEKKDELLVVSATVQDVSGERSSIERSKSPQDEATRQADIKGDVHLATRSKGGVSELEMPGTRSSTAHLPQDVFDEFIVSSPELVQAFQEREPTSTRIHEQIATPQDSQEPLSTENKTSHRIHGEDGTLDHGLPMTPEKTLSNLSEKEPAIGQIAVSTGAIALDMRQQKSPKHTAIDNVLILDSPRRRKPSRKLREQSQESIVTSPPSPRTVRKATSTHVSDVPEPISPWFSSRRSNKRASDTKRSSNDEEQFRDSANGRQDDMSGSLDVTPQHPTVTGAMKRNGNLRSPHLRRSRDFATQNTTQSKTTSSSLWERPDQGFRTPLSYYAPLSSLRSYLTSSSSSSQGAATIDVCAIVTSPSSKPIRAKKGPKDYSNLLHIADASIVSQTIQVQCFRPFQESLPQADVGDVILLREFAVKFRKDQCFLLSAESSSWHVWRFKNREDGTDQSNGNLSDPEPREETNGPPVETGKEEQSHARKLRAWWSHVDEMMSKQG